jgi:hypothetical protein
VAGQGCVSSSPPVTILISTNSAPNTPRIFSGTFANCSYVLNALGELRVFGNVGLQFGLTPADNLAYPQLAAWPLGVEKWRSVAAGSDSWALTEGGELYRSGWQKVPFPAGVSRWLNVAAGSGVALAVGDDGQIYLNGLTPVQFGPQGISWKDVAISVSGVVTLSKDYRAYFHFTGSYGEPVSAVVPLPPQVQQWLRVTATLREVILQADNGELYRCPCTWGLTGPPVLVERPAGVSAWTDFSAGGFHVLALGNNGRLYAWGRNWEGQLGVGTGGADINTLVPVLLPPGISRWKAIAAGYTHSLAIGEDCSLYAWGDNSYGQLGNGLTLGQNRPVPTAAVRGLCGAPVVFAEGEATPLDDGSIRVQFKSDLNRSYLVQYSEDLLQWKTASPALFGTGGTLEWIDDGPPKTDTHPSTESRRLYRLIYAQ